MRRNGGLRILIVDDHEVVRLGLWAALSKHHAVVGHAPNGEEAIARVRQTRPDVVVADLRLPDMRGEQLCRRLLEIDPHMSVVILSAYLSEETVRLSLEAGAAGYVTKAAGLPELLRVLQQLQLSSNFSVVETATQIVARLNSAVDARTEAVPLTPHQVSILELAAQGLTNNQISDRMYISESTVRFHLQNMKRRLGARSKTDLVVQAMRVGAISPAPESVRSA